MHSEKMFKVFEVSVLVNKALSHARIRAKPVPAWGAQRFSQGGLLRCRVLERIAEDMLAMAPDQAPDALPGSRSGVSFFRLTGDEPTVRAGRAFPGAALPKQAPLG